MVSVHINKWITKCTATHRHIILCLRKEHQDYAANERGAVHIVQRTTRCISRAAQKFALANTLLALAHVGTSLVCCALLWANSLSRSFQIFLFFWTCIITEKINIHINKQISQFLWNNKKILLELTNKVCPWASTYWPDAIPSHDIPIMV